MPSLDHVSEVLGLVHKRSFNELQRRIIRNIIFKNAYIVNIKVKLYREFQGLTF